MVDGARRGEDALDKLGDKGKKLGDTFGNLTSRANVLAAAFGSLAALGISKIFSDAVAAAATFETKMAEVSTLVDTAVFNMSLLTQAVRDQAIEFGSPAVDQAAAAYQIISAGAGTATDAINLMTASNKLAVGGVTTVAVAADGLTSILNAYGLASSQASDVSDALFIGMRAGKTTIGELSASLGKVAPLAAQAGVGVDELVGTVAALTKGGISTQESVTGVRAILAAVVKPTSEASKLAKQLGIDFSTAGLQSKGLAGFMEDLVQKTGGSTDAMAQLFGGVEALIPALALSGQAGVDLNKIMADMATKSGATQEAFDKMTNTFDFQAARVRQGITDALITLGSIITSALTPVLRVLADNFDAIGRFVTVAAAGFATLLIPSLLAMIPTVATATAGLLAMAAAWLLTPFGQIAALIIAASAALAYFGNTTVEVGGVTTTVWQTFTAAVSVAWDLISEGAAIVASVFGTATSAAGGFFTNVISWLTGFVGDWSDMLSGVGELIKSAINTYIGFYVGLVAAIGPVITDGIPALFKLAMALAVNAVIQGAENIVNIFARALGGIASALDYIPGLEGTGDKIRSALTVDLSGAKIEVEGYRTAVSDAGKAISTAFSNQQIDYVGAFTDKVSELGGALQDRLTTKLQATQDATAAATDAAAALGDTVTTTTTPAVAGLGGAAGGAAKAVDDLTKAQQEFTKSIDDEFAKIQEANGGAVAAVQAWYEDQKAKLNELGLAYTDYANKLEVIFNERLKEAYDKDLQNATDWRSGIERAVKGLGDSIGNESDLAETALTSLFDNATKAIVDFAKTGKLDFKEFARSVAADILQLTTKMLLLKALKGVLGLKDGGLVGGGGLGLKDGGIARLATGGQISGPGGPRSDVIPAMLSDGEFVMNADATKQFLPLLQAMNSGQSLKFADGGSPGGLSVPSQAPNAASGQKQAEDAGSGQKGAGSVTVNNYVTSKAIADALDTPEGEVVVMNIIERNRNTVKGVLS